MKRLILLSLISVALFVTMAHANPIYIREDIIRAPMLAENVTVHFDGDSAIVEGLYVFEADKLDPVISEIQIPVVVRADENLDLTNAKVAARIQSEFMVSMSGNLYGVRYEPYVWYPDSIEEALVTGLPAGLKLVFFHLCAWEVVSDSPVRLSITYRQPLYDGVFYYLPITRGLIPDARNRAGMSPVSWNKPDDGNGPTPYAFQARIFAEKGKQVSLAAPNKDAVWGDSSVTVFMRYLNLIAATQVSMPKDVTVPAPCVETIAGTRRCAIHHVPLEVRKVSSRCDSSYTVKLLKNCPNARLSSRETKDVSGSSKVEWVSAEVCPQCEADAERNKAEAKTKKQ